MSTSRYAREVDLRDLDSAHTLGILLTPPNTTVLDIGVADGHPVAQGLVEQGCTVYGVEIDAAAAKEAEQFCEQVVVGNVEELDLAATFPGQRFDAVLLLDVLEHLVDPAATLKKAAALLEPDGVVVTSIPAITHAAVKLHLMGGEFAYTDTGLLDRTHVHFFDRAEVDRLFADAGLPVHEHLRVRKSLQGTEISLDLDRYSDEVVAEAMADPEAETYQFIVVAGAPGTTSRRGPRGTLLERLQERVRADRRIVEEGAAYAKQVEEALAEKSSYAAELEVMVNARQAKVDLLQQELTERMEELTTLHEQLVALRSDVQVKDAYIADLVVASPYDAAPDVVNQVGYLAVDKAVRGMRRAPRAYRGLRGTTRGFLAVKRRIAARRGRAPE